MPDGRPLQGLRALVVEDDYFIASDLERFLTRDGAASVVLSGSVEDAMRQVGSGLVDFGLLDLNIRGEMCFGLADEFRRRRVPFAFVSGYSEACIPPRFAAVPNWGKPYDERRVVDGIRALWTPPAGA